MTSTFNLRKKLKKYNRKELEQYAYLVTDALAHLVVDIEVLTNNLEAAKKRVFDNMDVSAEDVVLVFKEGPKE